MYVYLSICKYICIQICNLLYCHSQLTFLLTISTFHLVEQSLKLLNPTSIIAKLILSTKTALHSIKLEEFEVP